MVWDAGGMKAVKSFGILIEGYRGGVGEIVIAAMNNVKIWDYRWDALR